MNYIALMNQFWQTRRSKRITNLQADLYFFLLQESNARNWENPFQCPNGLVCSAIGISEKSLIDARNVLQQIGLISFENGVTKQKAPTYYLHDYCNKVSKSVSKQGSNQGGNQVSNNAVIEGTLLDKQNEKKKNETTSSAPQAEAVKKKDEKTPYWKKLVDAWFDFYKKNFSIEPSFKGVDAKSLKDISERIRKASQKAGKQWTEDFAIASLKHFFTLAFSDEWLKRNFLLSNLASKFDSIIQKRNGNANSKTEQPTGSAVSSASILSKINDMPD